MARQDSKARRIIALLAGDRRVEDIVRKVAHTERLGADLEDLCQEVYVILLNYPADKIVDLWRTDCMGFFLARVIMNQLRSRTSRFYYTYKRFQALCRSLDGLDFSEDKADGR